MRICYTVSEKDFVEAQRLFRATILPLYRRAGRQAMMAFGAFLVAAAIFLFLPGRGKIDRPTTAAMGLCGVGLLGVYAFYPDYMAKQKYQTDGRIRREMTVEFSRSGVNARTGETQTESPWKNFAGYAESSGVFLLFLSSRLFLVFPKRAFEPAEIGPFRELLRENLPRMKAPGRGAAIPA
ncbi:MAG TPA: YcxB family protein [Verrucomicrobiae bacterium]|nr:YcxB family protein [Verrucomicrobiae bacterium]